jgi:hypothetical protein
MSSANVEGMGLDLRFVVSSALCASFVASLGAGAFGGDAPKGYRFDLVERQLAAADDVVPTPGPFAPALAAALARRDMFEHRSRSVVLGLQSDEFDESGAGRPSRWYVRGDGTTRVEYSFFGRRATLIFDPHAHRLVWIDPQTKTYHVYDTGPDDAFFGSVEQPRTMPSPRAGTTPEPAAIVARGTATIDGTPVRVYVGTTHARNFAEERVDYVSSLPRPPIVPFPGFYQAMSLVGKSQPANVHEAPDGLVLYRVVTYSSVRLAQMFKKTPDSSDRTTHRLICQRGNVAPLRAVDAALFVPPSDFTHTNAIEPLPRFMFGRDSDDFVAFHECDDVVAPRSKAVRP